jgi:hypothetical protein
MVHKKMLDCVFVQQFLAEDPYHKSQAEILADLRQSWHEAMTGQTIPVAQLWEGWEDD